MPRRPTTSDDLARLVLADLRDITRAKAAKGEEPSAELLDRFLELYKVHGPASLSAGLLQEIADLKSRLKVLENSAQMRRGIGRAV